MIQKTDDLAKLLSEIAAYDKAILYDLRLFKSYLSDLYIGRKLSLNIFLSFLMLLPKEEEKLSALTEDQVTSIHFPVTSKEELDIIECTSQLLINIYVRKNYVLTEIFRKSKSKTTKVSYAKKIHKLRVNKSSVVYGDDIYIQWYVDTPYYMTLSDGETSMDVTSLNSLNVSAIKDTYYLYLFDECNKVIDTKLIKLHLEAPLYCINCGSRFIDKLDLYCCQCGTKRV